MSNKPEYIQEVAEKTNSKMAFEDVLTFFSGTKKDELPITLIA
ncbi:hypothetical protein [Bacillus sp. SM2101]|nr:hypothetical protein [Bacillus sp. SM2101]